MLRLGYSNFALCVIVIFAIATTINDNLSGVAACDLDQATSGCRIDNGACQCGYGCKSEYRYPDRATCTTALKGRSNNVCDREPCLHGGTCIQISQPPKYECKCEGTGFWGNTCQRKCPDLQEMQLMPRFPHECIII